MDHDIVGGVLAGLLGPHLAQWLSRYRYWVIFFTTTIFVYIALFVALVWSSGMQFALQAIRENLPTTAGILAPMGIGLLAVFIAFVGSLDAWNKNDENSSK